VLVGKGITFDTGGISLKPGEGMDEMKYDMCGAATVLGIFKALAILQPKIQVTGIIASCENMPSGSATKPGDVIKSMNGLTIEVLNTDAEGRLILCDALTYAQKITKPRAIIDIATLTGACVIALGSKHSGMYCNDEKLQKSLLLSSKKSGDTVWPMPLDEEYSEQLKSNFADLANIGGRPAGSVTAACFLHHFINDGIPWAHLDIAGTAWLSGKNKGSTARPISLLLDFIVNQIL
jgi:leucyl aminopeptidase